MGALDRFCQYCDSVQDFFLMTIFAKLLSKKYLNMPINWFPLI